MYLITSWSSRDSCRFCSSFSVTRAPSRLCILLWYCSKFDLNLIEIDFSLLFMERRITLLAIFHNLLI